MMKNDDSDDNNTTVDDEAGDSDPSSLISDDEAESTASATVQQVPTAVKYREILLEEEEEIEKLITDTLETTVLVNRFEKYTKSSKLVFSRTSFQDITPMFVDGTPFLLDGLSLVTCVLRDSNYRIQNGGQTLHFIYICERIIEFICRKGGTCEVIFFNDKDAYLQSIPDYCLLLSLLKIHLKRNTNIGVHEMESIFSSQFISYVEEVHPCLLMIDFTFIETFRHRLPKESVASADVFFHFYGLFTLALGLYCVDISYFELSNNLLYSFVCSLNSKQIKQRMIDDYPKYSLCSACIDSQFSELLNNNKPSTKNLKRFITLQVAKVLHFNFDKEIIKVYLLYYAIAECLPLSCRTLNISDVDEPVKKKVQEIVDNIVYCINICLQSETVDGFDCSRISDIWHGNLFVIILKYVVYMDSLKLGKTVDTLYEELLKEFNAITGSNLVKFPVLANNVKEKFKKELYNNRKQDEIVNLKPDSSSFINNATTKSKQAADADNLETLIRPFGNMVTNFCSDVVYVYRDFNLQKSFKPLFEANIKYDKNYDWHIIKPITDEYDRIRDTNKDADSLPLKRRLKLKAQFAYYMALYGSNIEGKILEYDPIVVSEGKKDQGSKKKQKKQGKSSGGSKKEKIIEQIKMEKEKKLLEAEKQKFDNFLKIYKSNKSSMLEERDNLSLVNSVLLKTCSEEYICKLLYYKVEILLQLWIEDYKNKLKNGNLNLNYLKELFLTIRQVLYCSKKDQSFLTDSQRKKLGKMLCSIGFPVIAAKWNLPLGDPSANNTYAISNNLSYIRFQLQHLGPELERKTEGQHDDRVTGFIPDPWQKKLFDIVDKSQSALIVAPTSSGKTYASYYCMKKIITGSNDDRVIYIAPTKALVNQVGATIFARFKKNLPAGMSLFGIFTLEYRYFALNSQILVTVPECLEMLLMSPRYKSWAKSLKYVIFDEVHCLAGNGGGITWERCLMLIQCPFLALSATIQNPREFWTWMSNMEAYKKSLNPKLGTEVHLVVHSERHNDLVKHVYGEDKELHHIHPYAYLKDFVMKVHGGIPQHISLAPSECVELYDAMKAANPNDTELTDAEPDKYFSKTETGFLCRQDVRMYETKLKTILEKWFTEKKELFSRTINNLYEPLAVHETGTRNPTYFENHIIDLVQKLNSKDMLPAIVFSDNRGYCEMFGSYLALHFKDLEDKYIAQKKPKTEIMTYDDDDRDFDEEFSRNKKTKQTSFDKTGKLERRKRDFDMFPLGITNSILEFSLRGKCSPDNKDLQFIERRLSREYSKTSVEIEELRRGVGVHHYGIRTKLRQAVEMLFRTKFLNVVFATGTLALGVHMPCKTVVILGDSPQLNTLQYHQMSGRSGRRGYDKTGDVVFFGLDSNKTRVLMTSKLPRMIGNFPLTVTTILRLLKLLNDDTEQSKETDELNNATFQRVLTVLSQGMLYKTEKNLYNQMKHFVLFSCQLLMIHRLIDSDCRPTLMANIATILKYYEPGNLAFVYLLRRGIITKLCKSTSNGVVNPKACETIVNLLCRLFTKMPLTETHFERKCTQSLVKLPPLPDFVTEALMEYNTEIETLFKHYYKGLCQHITETVKDDDKLPISGKVFSGACTNADLVIQDGETPTFEAVIAGNSKHNLICSAFAGLSGQTDESIYHQDSLISNIRHQVYTDCNVIPLINLNKPINGYAYDFYKHGTLRYITKENGLKSGHDFAPLNEFLIVLKSIETSLSEMGMSYPGVELKHATDKNNLNLALVDTFGFIRHTYESSFKSVYNIDKQQ